MAYVPAGFIVGWPGASAIPSGWERATELDDVHPKGAAASADPGTSGGSATHEHTSPTHSHTIGSHQHSGGSSGLSTSVAIGDHGSPDTKSIAGAVHAHTNPTSGAQTGALSSVSGTWATATNDPPYYTVRWIRSLGTTQGIPDGAWAYWDAAALPSGWSSPSAVRLKYLKGASASANGGSTGGSSSAHSHAANGHTHGISAHSHSGGSTGISVDDQTDNGPSTIASGLHTHTATYASSSGSSSDSTTSASSGSTTAEVPYVKLGIVQNDNGAVSLPVGVIGLWLGLLTALPGSLLLCDGAGGTQDTRGKYVKGADVSAGSFTGIGGTGGTATHDHTDPASHTHSAAHTHSITYSSGSGTASALAGSSVVGQNAAHSHGTGTSGSAGGTSGSGTQTVDDANHEPPYRTVAFVKFTGTIDVTVSSPTEAQELTAPSLTVAWSLSAGTQSSKRIRIYAEDQSTVVYDSGVIANSTASYDLPSTAGLRTGNTYYVRVSVVNNSGTPGDSSLVSFTTNWTPPSVLSGMTARVIGGV